MNRSLMILTLIASLSTLGNVMADTPNTSDNRREDDAVFFCDFKKGDDFCQAFGKFDPKKPRHGEVKQGDRDDLLVVACGECKDSHHGGCHDRDGHDKNQNKIIYDDGIEWLLANERDHDHDRDCKDDTIFRGKHHGAPSILVKDFDWEKISGEFKASLEIKEDRDEHKLRGHCTFYKSKHQEHGPMLF